VVTELILMLLYTLIKTYQYEKCDSCSFPGVAKNMYSSKLKLIKNLI